MEQYRIDVLRQGAEYPAFGTSQIRADLGGKSSPQVAPILNWLVREGYVKALDFVYGPHGWERAWAVTERGRAHLPYLVAV
jgi:hypothetical protein